jgi:hypothetical protein
LFLHQFLAREDVDEIEGLEEKLLDRLHFLEGLTSAHRGEVVLPLAALVAEDVLFVL